MVTCFGLIQARRQCFSYLLVRKDLDQTYFSTPNEKTPPSENVKFLHANRKNLLYLTHFLSLLGLNQLSPKKSCLPHQWEFKMTLHSFLRVYTVV